MAFEGYIKLDGIPGESTDDKHKDWIEINGFQMGLGQASSASHSTAGGSAAGKVNFQDISITHLVDKASAKFFELCAKGTHIKDGTIELCRAGGEKFKYLEIKLENILITSMTENGDPVAGVEFPTETITLNFGKIKFTYFKQNEKGGGAGQVAFGWDLTINKSI
jgi:type VI secretion system secreted protein Hcp